MEHKESINKFLETVLGFSKPWYVEEMIQTDQEITIILDYPKGTIFTCPRCDKPCHVYDHRWKTFRHLDWWQYKTNIKIKIPRIQCCQKTLIPKINWLRRGSKFTKMMENHIIDLAKTSSINKASKLLRITDTQMWRIVHYHVNKCRKNADFSDLTNLGIDETSKKGHNYITNFVDLDKRKVMYIALGKDAQTVSDFVLDLELHGGCRENVLNTTSDMSLVFEKGIHSEFTNSSIVIDKFHVIKHFNDAVNATLRLDIASGYDFKKSKYVWMKNYENLTQKQMERLEQMNRVHSMTGRAYQMKVMMQEIYKLTSKVDAAGALDGLISWMKRSRNEYMKKVAMMLVGHYGDILNYFDNRLTNAILEGLNNVVQSVKRVARGFRSGEYFRCMVYLHCGAFEVKV